MEPAPRFADWLTERLKEGGRGEARRLADHLGASPSQITRWQAGSEPFAKWFDGMATFFGVPVESIRRMVVRQLAEDNLDDPALQLAMAVRSAGESLQTISQIMDRARLADGRSLPVPVEAVTNLVDQINYLREHTGDAPPDFEQSLARMLDALETTFGPLVEAVNAGGRLNETVGSVTMLEARFEHDDEAVEPEPLARAAEGAKGRKVTKGRTAKRPGPKPEPDPT